jgi:hypothetical protein
MLSRSLSIGAMEKSVRDWLAVTGGILALIGVVGYIVIDISYATFFGPLGVSPQEVGLGYKETLNAAGVGLFLWFLISFGTWAVAVGVGPGTPQLRHLFYSVVGALVLITLTTIAHTIFRSMDVRQGHIVKPIRFLYVIPAVPISAQPSEVSWASSPSPTVPGINMGCLMYLGSANSVDIFYDPKNKRTDRIPASAIIVKTKPRPEDCHPAAG